MSDETIDFASALTASGPTSEYPTAMNLFGRLVGTWRVHSSRLDEGTGDWQDCEFTWTVSYILGGRAVQDVALVDAVDGHDTIATAVRVYDASMGAWRVSYFEPVRGEYCHLVASGFRRDGIRQDGTRNDGHLIRWNFSGITSDAYTWESFVSDDEGTTWVLTEHNEGVRVG
ncbi:hypothetical protein GCM10027416_31280 [Okibacterium endophyticum]